MEENSIEETIKQLELILKVRKEQKEIIECAGGWCVNCDSDIKALTESIDILKDYKRVLKENEYIHNELNKQQTTINKYAKENEELKILKSGIQTLQNLGIEDGKYIVMSKTDFLNGSCKHLLDDYISKQEIKDKIRKNEEIIDISNDGDLIHELLQKNKVYEELLESEE